MQNQYPGIPDDINISENRIRQFFNTSITVFQNLNFKRKNIAHKFNHLSTVKHVTSMDYLKSGEIYSLEGKVTLLTVY